MLNHQHACHSTTTEDLISTLFPVSEGDGPKKSRKMAALELIGEAASSQSSSSDVSHDEARICTLELIFASMNCVILHACDEYEGVQAAAMELFDFEEMPTTIDEITAAAKKLDEAEPVEDASPVTVERQRAATVLRRAVAARV